MSERVLIVHWVPPTARKAVCGEEARVSYVEGRHKHYRHVYVTLSLHAVTCSMCLQAVGLHILAQTEL
jgi:hypothetical protein